jgi:membrane protein
VGIFTVLYLISQVLVLSAEISAVREAGLSPRGLTNAAVTDGDHRALTLLARRQERVAGQRVTTTFEATSGTPSPRDRGRPARR